MKFIIVVMLTRWVLQRAAWRGNTGKRQPVQRQGPGVMHPAEYNLR